MTNNDKWYGDNSETNEALRALRPQRGERNWPNSHWDILINI
jgi:hypothetical protein